MVSQREAEGFMLDTPSVEDIRHWSKAYSAKAHLAGDLEHATAIRDLWRSYGISTEIVRYDVLQNFPEVQSLELHDRQGGVSFVASLAEDELPEDPTSSPARGLPAFHGFSANGAVCAELVYANFGTLQDFRLLESWGVSVRGKVVICKYAKVFRGLKVRAAQQFGAAAVIMYNDPQEDGEYTTKNGYPHYPHGPARHPKTIQRGSVDFFSVAVGDPTTPGYPSVPDEDVRRVDPTHAIPEIPSLPISYADAEPLLRSLNGCGLSPEEMGGGDWRGELDGIDYCTGPSAVKVSLVTQCAYKYAPIYNVIGTIPGATEECVVLGNHHDSWCCGAVDPVSGSAAMNEVARSLGGLQKRGWVPRRTIILASWDNEEYGLVGSTEWAEDKAEYLSQNCVAYLNVDESTNGGKFLGATGSPLLNSVLREVAAEIPSPITQGLSVYDDWLAWQRQSLSSPQLEKPGVTLMGTGSDYTVFFDHLGIPSVDMLFNQQGQGVYPYHSNYDSYYWLDKFGDVGFRKHLAMAQLWGVLAVRLAGTAVVSFCAEEYANVLGRHVEELRSKMGGRVSVEGLREAVALLRTAAAQFDALASRAQSQASANGSVPSDEDIANINRTYMEIERACLLEKGKGLPGRPWYRHMIFAPGLWYGYDGVIFPGIVECLEDGDDVEAAKWVERITEAIGRITKLFQKHL
ncbi:hypothetical protein VTK73DRAFT_4339 [Phialemonium thermophilum]|uniref:Glutamate carboxypeptidase n=1 Tax=Phialemonium thermophilum TaxID=223376 RepID=A0ABR3WU14_9PEZI